jgi:hypothetical protein
MLPEKGHLSERQFEQLCHRFAWQVTVIITFEASCPPPSPPSPPVSSLMPLLPEMISQAPSPAAQARHAPSSNRAPAPCAVLIAPSTRQQRQPTHPCLHFSSWTREQGLFCGCRFHNSSLLADSLKQLHACMLVSRALWLLRESTPMHLSEAYT